MRHTILFLSLVIISVNCFANDVATTTTQNTVSENTLINTTRLNNAKAWDLSDTEWQRYVALMKGAAGHYFSQLTPLEVLGYYASDDTEMRRYAEMDVKADHEAIDRSLKFDAVYHDVARKLYQEPMVRYDRKN